MNTVVSIQPNKVLLASHEISLENRQPDRFVNGVFKDNILLNIAYMKGAVKKGSLVNWEDIRKPFKYEFILNPGEIFAFHEDVLPEFKGKVTKTTNAHFSSDEGFKSDGYLIGDGVCHLASLMNWVAKDGSIESKAPTNHDFAFVNEIPKQFGTAIFNQMGAQGVGEAQNLYIKNTFDKPLIFEFDFNGDKLKFSAFKQE